MYIVSSFSWSVFICRVTSATTIFWDQLFTSDLKISPQKVLVLRSCNLLSEEAPKSVVVITRGSAVSQQAHMKCSWLDQQTEWRHWHTWQGIQEVVYVVSAAPWCENETLSFAFRVCLGRFHAPEVPSSLSESGSDSAAGAKDQRSEIDMLFGAYGLQHSHSGYWMVSVKHKIEWSSCLLVSCSKWIFLKSIKRFSEKFWKY